MVQTKLQLPLLPIYGGLFHPSQLHLSSSLMDSPGLNMFCSGQKTVLPYHFQSVFRH